MVRTSRRQTRSAVATITRLSDLCLDGPTAPEPAGLDPTLRVTIHNVVATASFGATFDLEHLAWKCYGEYTPRQDPSQERRGGQALSQTPPKSASRRNEHHSYSISFLARSALGRGLGKGLPSPSLAIWKS